MRPSSTTDNTLGGWEFLDEAEARNTVGLQEVLCSKYNFLFNVPTSVGEDVEKLEHLCTGGGSVNQCSSVENDMK